MRSFPLVVNGAYAIFYAYTLYFDYGRTEEFQNLFPIPGNFWSKYVWLTMINLTIQFLYHCAGTYFAITSKTNTQNTTPQNVFHFISTTIAFPLSVTVVTLFWGLIYLDPDFVLTDEAKLMLSITWYNHALHTVPLIAMIVDFIAWRHPQPRIYPALKATVAFIMFYLTDVHLVFFYTGKWAYPILDQLDLPKLIGFYIICIGVFFFNFLMGYGLNQMIGPIQRPVPKPRKKRE
uniref:Uncharacterized protein n=1 Tax=Panagrolaimus superbus TaxID=310955 RepID=A0A914Z5X1_9BILA